MLAGAARRFLLVQTSHAMTTRAPNPAHTTPMTRPPLLLPESSPPPPPPPPPMIGADGGGPAGEAGGVDVGGVVGAGTTVTDVVGCAGVSATATPKNVPLDAAVATAVEMESEAAAAATRPAVTSMRAVTTMEADAIERVTSAAVTPPPAVVARLAL
eukprot:4039752-Prymnesium_polylepis.1